MKPEKQRIKIAEACPLICHKSLNEEVGYCWNNGTNWAHSEFDPLNDLNAMHEAEKVLRGNDVRMFDHHLCRIVHKALTDDDWSEEKGISIATQSIHATAAQRAEAFLQTLNLWKP